MNRYIIEKRDRELVEKFRAAVESKERRKKRNRIRLFGVLSVIFCAALIVFEKNSSPPVAPESVMYKSNTILLNRGGGGTLPSQTVEAAQPPEAEIMEVAAMAHDKNPQLPDPVTRSAKPVIPAEKGTMEPMRVLTPQDTLSEKKGLSELQIPPVRKTDIRIAEILTCPGIKNRQAVARKNVFSIQDGASPHVWMDVRSKDLPYTLRHIYYHNGRRYCAVPLKIRYPRTRTWSNVTLRHQHEAGLWRVDVVTQKGETLSRVEFSVVP